jgi:2-polyprenyl-3-methyl-5-hydroxy-6-metoxy-1,4-benzoquinol methylase
MSYSKLLQQKEWWDNKWKSIFESYQHDLRVGHYINALRNDNETNILELGAGSFRDTNQLSKFGLQVNANDFSQTSVDLAKTTFPLLKDKIKQMDEIKQMNFLSIQMPQRNHSKWILPTLQIHCVGRILHISW